MPVAEVARLPAEVILGLQIPPSEPEFWRIRLHLLAADASRVYQQGYVMSALNKRLPVLAILAVVCVHSAAMASALVLLSDFGTKDTAVAAMKGVAYGVSAELKTFDLTHEIPPFNVWEAAYRLKQAMPYWPAGTVFVCVVDPGVGTGRKSVVLKTKTGHYVVTPDNGMLTFVVEEQGVAELRQIDESVNRRPGSLNSYTFHGRDVYAYTGARLAAGAIAFEQVGKRLPPRAVSIDYQRPAFVEGGLRGTIPVLDIRFGNVWTNIDSACFAKLGAKKGDLLRVIISDSGKTVFEGDLPYMNCFGDVPVGKPLAYLNGLLNLSFALNMKSFAQAHGIQAGPKWQVRVEKSACRSAGILPRAP